jgi:hypothetical protein
MPTPLEWPLRSPIEAAGEAIGIATMVGDSAAGFEAAGQAIGVATMTGAPVQKIGVVTLLPAEAREQYPFPYPALEAIRRHTLSAVTSEMVFNIQARTITVIAYATDVRAIFDGIFVIDAKQLSAPRIYPRALLDIDQELAIVHRWFTQAFGELLQLGVPQVYLDILTPRLESRIYSDRIAAICAIVLLASILILESE